MRRASEGRLHNSKPSATGATADSPVEVVFNLPKLSTALREMQPLAEEAPA